MEIKVDFNLEFDQSNWDRHFHWKMYTKLAFRRESNTFARVIIGKTFVIHIGWIVAMQFFSPNLHQTIERTPAIL